MTSNLEKLHQWASSKYEDYISMVAIGSIAVDDLWIEGRSDHDILLIFERYPTSIYSDLEEYLKGSEFDETYLFTPLLKSVLLGPKNNTHDFSNKFRSKTLYGIDLISEVKLPTREVIQFLYKEGLKDVTRKISHRIAHTSLWSDEKVRDVFWKLFKHSFMYLAIRAYAISGSYPRTRADVAKYYASDELKIALEALNTINEQPRENIISAARNLVYFIERF